MAPLDIVSFASLCLTAKVTIFFSFKFSAGSLSGQLEVGCEFAYDGPAGGKQSCASTQDQREVDIYMNNVSEIFKGHPVKVLAAHGPQQVLEGAAPEGVVIVEFPTNADARVWYDGPAYQAVTQHRFKGARYRAVLVEGV